MLKIATVLFYLVLSLFFFHVGVPYLEVILAICALILAIASAM